MRNGRYRSLMDRAFDYGFFYPDAAVEQFFKEHKTWEGGDAILLSYPFTQGQVARAMQDIPEILERRTFRDRRVQSC